MAEANIAAGARPVANNNGTQRTSGASALSRVGTVRPVNSVSSILGFSQALDSNFTGNNGQSGDNGILPPNTGPGMLSKDLQFLLAETRMQEEQASSPAPANIGRAIKNYNATQIQVQKTIGAARLAAAGGLTQQRNGETAA